MANVSKAEIVDQLADQIGLTKKEVAEVVEGFLAQVITALEEGRQVQIRGFGTFKIQLRAPICVRCCPRWIPRIK